MKTYKRVCKVPPSLGTGLLASKTKDQPVCSWRDMRTWLTVCGKQLIALQRSDISQVKHRLGICKSLTIAFTWLTLPRMLCLLPWYPLSWWPCPMHSSSFADIPQPDVSPLLQKAVLSWLHGKRTLFSAHELIWSCDVYCSSYLWWTSTLVHSTARNMPGMAEDVKIPEALTHFVSPFQRLLSVSGWSITNKFADIWQWVMIS